MMGARELTSPVDLCSESGRLNPRAIGWCRTPLVRANLRGRGRAKRWDYWGIQSAEAFIGITVSDLDYATLLAVHAFAPGSAIVAQEVVQPLRRLKLAEVCNDEPLRVDGGGLFISVQPIRTSEMTGTHDLAISVRTDRVEADISVRRPAERDSLGVVVPWGPRRFQYTVKDVGLPASGRLTVDGAIVDLPAGGTYATRDFGRGQWPYRVTWNWGAGAGSSDEHEVALQVGGQWTDGTGSTENGVFVDGHLHKINSELEWTYDTNDWLRPWTIRGRQQPDVADLTFHPERVREAKTEFGVIGSRAHQAFGTWQGWVLAGTERLNVTGLRGWAEDVRNRW